MSEPLDLGSTIPGGGPPGRPGRARPAYHLVLVEGEPLRRAVALSGERLVLGRDPARPFHLSDPRISRAHCEVWVERQRVHVRDLGSTNGTFLDGGRVEGERMLSTGALLQVGRYSLRVELLAPEEAARLEDAARDLVRARRYVEELIPPPLGTGPVRTEWCFVPSAALGGDALGYGGLPGGGFAAYVLDVCGHGTGSAMHAATVLNVLRARTLPDTDFADPAQVLTRLNAAFPMESHAGMFFSLWYGVLDPASGALRYASAGHPPALRRPAGGGALERLGLKAPPIGTRAGQAYAGAEARLAAGDRLYVFSDGVYEVAAADGRELQLEDFEARLAAVPAPGDGEAAALYAAACADAGTTLDDDFTLLVVTPSGAAAA